MAGRDVHQEVTDRIVAALEAGTAPWVRPWNGVKGTGGFPVNASTGKQYNGVNVFLLWMQGVHQGYTSDRWLTFNQAKKVGGTVRRGEKGTGIVFFNWREVADRKDPSKRTKIPLLRFYTVFNVAQCDGLPAKVMGPPPVAVEPTQAPLPRNERAERFLEAARAGMNLTVTRGGGEAFYIPSQDVVRLPAFDTFVDAAAAYATEAHEMGHATGHKSRLNRDLCHAFGGEAYAAEELIAEMTSAFVCAHLGLAGKLQHPEYIASWIKVLKGNKRALFTAASAARKAHAYMATAAGEPLEGEAPSESDGDEE